MVELTDLIENIKKKRPYLTYFPFVIDREESYDILGRTSDTPSAANGFFISIDKKSGEELSCGPWVEPYEKENVIFIDMDPKDFGRI